MVNPGSTESRWTVAGAPPSAVSACRVQAASDVYSPVSGEVLEVNSSLVEDPSKVCTQLPHTRGSVWTVIFDSLVLLVHALSAVISALIFPNAVCRLLYSYNLKPNLMHSRAFL